VEVWLQSARVSCKPQNRSVYGFVICHSVRATTSAHDPHRDLSHRLRRLPPRRHGDCSTRTEAPQGGFYIWLEATLNKLKASVRPGEDAGDAILRLALEGNPTR
jgi:hypothetical protein